MTEPASSEPTVSVIVPTWRDWVRLGTCLRALGEQTLPATRFEVLVVNNDPDDPVPAALAPAPNVRILVEATPGSYAARNHALRAARGRILAFTDADCVPDPQWLERAIAWIDAGDVRIAGHIELFFQGPRLTPAEAYEKAFAFRQDLHALEGRAATANLVVRAEVFERVGPFDTTHFSGGDYAWNQRATELGVPLVYREDVRVRHPARASMEALLRKARRVVGGSSKVRGPRTGGRYLGFATRALRNALGEVVALSRRADLSPRERVVAYTVANGLRVYRFAQVVLLDAGVKDADRGV